MNFGELGKIASDGHQIQCHICGRWFHHLGTHVFKKHSITAAQYREKFGLNRTTSLASPDFQKTQRDGQSKRLSKYWGIGVNIISNQTPEQRSRKVTPRLQGNLNRKAMNSRPEKIALQKKAAADGTLSLFSEEAKAKAAKTRLTPEYKEKARERVLSGEAPLFRADVREKALKNAHSPEARAKRIEQLNSPEVQFKISGDNSHNKRPENRAQKAEHAKLRKREKGRFAPGAIKKKPDTRSSYK